MVEAYVYDTDESSDFTAPHHSGKQVPMERLEKLGVFYSLCKSIEELDSIAAQRQYLNRDEVTIRPESFPSEAEYRKKLEVFFKEHLHEDEEIRYTVEGSGYFDIRDSTNEEWIRIKVAPYDLLVVPAGVYHRFTVTHDNYIRAIRLFKDQPKWVAFNRPDADQLPIRREYLQSICR